MKGQATTGCVANFLLQVSAVYDALRYDYARVSADRGSAESSPGTQNWVLGVEKMLDSWIDTVAGAIGIAREEASTIGWFTARTKILAGEYDSALADDETLVPLEFVDAVERLVQGVLMCPPIDSVNTASRFIVVGKMFEECVRIRALQTISPLRKKLKKLQKQVKLAKKVLAAATTRPAALTIDSPLKNGQRRAKAILRPSKRKRAK